MISKDQFTALHTSKKEVSIILAVRNEEGYIGKCIRSLINQDFPKEKYEIIIIDGLSDDKTLEVIAQYQAAFPDIVKVFSNKKRTSPHGRNIGIKKASGDIVVIFGGHAMAHQHYLNAIVERLKNSNNDVAGVGAVHFPPDDETFFGRVMADMQMSILGGAGTSFRKPQKDISSDSIAFTAYKKWILEKVGLHDEKFEVGQDLELNCRIKKAGFKLMISPEAIAYYYRKHNSFTLLSKRMMKYGMARALVAKKHPQSFKVPYAISALIVISVISLPIVVFILPFLATLILAGLTLYLFAILINSIYFSFKRRNPKYLISFPMYIVEHFSIGLGFIAGFFRK